MKRRLAVCLSIFLCLSAVRADAQTPALTIVNAVPKGEVATRAEANVVIVFSEPMVALGRIPAKVTVPFVKIAPSVQGAFSWSGTTTLIFIPDSKKPL
ncbi:MAG TPA: hypothetical protein VNJ03_13230, partial [Vicinamibacterales bacterium]|nr:hypothetical protein [Vicinamibacterales bacterium]